jgi:alpha-glucosidase (family GH31 glycosyl hydrolase)
MEVEADGPGADCLLITGTSSKDILSIYSDLTGRPSVLPRWALGLRATESPQEGGQTLLDHVEAHRARPIQLDAVNLDYHWEERLTPSADMPRSSLTRRVGSSADVGWACARD